MLKCSGPALCAGPRRRRLLQFPLLLQKRKRNFGSKIFFIRIHPIDSTFIPTFPCHHQSLIKTDSSHTHTTHHTDTVVSSVNHSSGSRQLVPTPGRATHTPPPFSASNIYSSLNSTEFQLPLSVPRRRPPVFVALCVCVWMCAMSKALQSSLPPRLHQPAPTRPMSLRCPVPPRPRV